MPRYFFHSMDGHVSLDEEGTVLASDNVARHQATILAAEILKGEPEHLDEGRSLRIEVSNGMGAILFTVVVTSVDAGSAEVKNGSP